MKRSVCQRGAVEPYPRHNTIFPLQPKGNYGIVILGKIKGNHGHPVMGILLSSNPDTAEFLHPFKKISGKLHFLPVYLLYFVVDRAQSAGTLEIDMERDGIDYLAFTGHKGLLGPQGIGGFLISEALDEKMIPYIAGGTGSLVLAPIRLSILSGRTLPSLPVSAISYFTPHPAICCILTTEVPRGQKRRVLHRQCLRFC